MSNKHFKFKKQTEKMETIKSTFFEATINYEITTDEGMNRRVTESYVTEADTFTEAEANIYKQFGKGEDVGVKKLAIAPYSELIRPEEDIEEPRYYKVSIKIITLDERTAKEKTTKVCHLVEAPNIDVARSNVKEVYSATACDYEIVSLVETKILEII